jgi:hypothetical protein
MIMIETSVTLRCDHCKVAFLYRSSLRASEPEGSAIEIAGQGMGAVDSVCSAIAALRNMAQEASWAEILPIGQPRSRDLCPACFTLPPEG